MAEKQTIDAMWDDSPVDVSTEVNFYLVYRKQAARHLPE